jgi:hypothetical protein
MTERSLYPSDEEVHEDLMEQLLLGIHVAMPGRIQSYDATRQVADIVLQLKHTHPDPEGTGEYLHEDYPVLPAVPVLWPRMGKWFMAASVEPGDAVQVLFNSSAIGMWRRSTVTDGLSGLQRALQGVSLVGNLQRHHLTHAVALLGLETYGGALAHAPPVAASASDVNACLTMGHDADDGLRFSLYRDGRVKLTKGETVLAEIDTSGVVHLGGAAAVTKALGIAELIDARLSALRTAMNMHTHPASSGTTSATVDGQVAALASVAATKVLGV